MEILENEWEVLTDEGWSDFSALKISETSSLIELKLEDSTLQCTIGHRVMTNLGWKEVQQLKPKDKCITFNGIKRVISVSLVEKTCKVYDLVGVKKNSRYFTNNVLSHNCDEFAHLKPSLAEEFIASVFPTVSSSETSKLAIISTPNGLNHFYKLWTDAENGNNDFVPVTGHWNEHPKRSQQWADDQLKTLGEIKFRQEILVTFEGSSYTLIDGSKLSTIPLSRPIFEKDCLEIFKSPEKDKSYVITVDVSRGRHQDYSAYSVIDISQMPYEVVATFKDNTISTLEYPHLLYNTAKQYNNAFILIEINDLGEEVSNTLWYEYEYENVYFTSGDDLTQLKGYPGVRTTKKVKSLGCSVLKDLIEKDQLILNSHQIIQELGIFVLNRGSYATDDPAINDDLCTTLWLFAWLTKQQVFQEITNHNLRKTLTEKKQEFIDASLTPFGFYQDGRDGHNQSKSIELNKQLPEKNKYNLTPDQIELLKM
jgi:hypothetical protein